MLERILFLCVCALAPSVERGGLAESLLSLLALMYLGYLLLGAWGPLGAAVGYLVGRSAARNWLIGR